MTKTVCVVGMASEAAIIGERPGVQVVVGAGDAKLLTSRLDAVSLGAERILSLGVCGALGPDRVVGEVIVGVSVSDESGAIIHSDKEWSSRLFRALKDTSSAGRFPVNFANVVSTTAPVATVAQREAVRASTAADVVDMESFLVGSAARAHRLPFAILRVVLDEASFDLPQVALLPLRPDGSPDIWSIIGSLMSNLGQGPALLQLGSWSEKAMGNLALALACVGSDFGSNN